MEIKAMSINALLSKFIPVPLAIKGLSKLDSKLGKFIFDATAYGYGADQILEHLRGQFETKSQKQERARLESGAENLRPDELANLQSMKQNELPATLGQKAVGIATGLGGGLAGLNEEGEPNEQVKTNAGRASQVTPIQEEQMEPPQPKQIPQGILEALSPKLKQFIEDRLSKGSGLAQIASLAKSHFLDEIAKIQEASGMEFSDFLESLYGKQRESARAIGLKNQPSNNEAKNAFLQGLKQLSQSLGG